MSRVDGEFRCECCCQLMQDFILIISSFLTLVILLHKSVIVMGLYC